LTSLTGPELLQQVISIEIFLHDPTVVVVSVANPFDLVLMFVAAIDLIVVI